MTTATRTANAEDLLRMPDDGRRCELVHGEIRTMSPAGGEHGLVAMRMALATLGSYVKEHGLGEVVAAETGFLLATSPDHVRAADAAFIVKARLGKLRGSIGYWQCAPDVAT